MAALQIPKWQLKNPFAFTLPGVGMSSFESQAAKTPFWGFQVAKKSTVPAPSILGKVKVPSLGTTAKVAATGTIVYGAYKASESVGRLFETGSPFVSGKKGSGTPGAPGAPVLPEGFAGTFVYAPQPPANFWGGVGEGLGKGAEGVGEGIGNVLPLAVVAIGAYFILTSKKEKKRK